MTVKFCFIGHVDSGKSTIGGHLIKAVGAITEHDFEMIRKKCIEDNKLYQLYSRVLDIFEEEQHKGKTHEFNSYHFDFKGTQFELIDTPGHKMYIREMIRGVSLFESADIIGCLIISAAKGEFESGWVNGQTREAIIICRAIGIDKLVVLVNKMDTVDWSEQVYSKIRNTVQPFLQDVCRFKGIEFLPVSGYKGINLVDGEKTLIDTLVRFSEQKMERPPTKKMDPFNIFTADVNIIQTDSLITVGSKFMMHYTGGEWEVELVKLSVPFVSGKALCKVVCKCDKIVYPEYNSERFILRTSTNTCGYGKISTSKLVKVQNTMENKI